MVTELYAVGFLRTILTLVIIYYVGKFLFRWWLKRKVENAVKQREKTISEFEADQKRHAEGSVHVKSKENTRSNTRAGSSAGDYVDYEEVD